MTFKFQNVVWIEETTSTNEYIKESVAGLSTADARGRVIAARRQTAGKGRLGTVWLSAGSGDLLFSFVWTGAPDLATAGTLPMACALGVRDFLAAYGIKALCKWPNDVMVGEEKICGILTEGGIDSGGSLRLIIGIGVNVADEPERDARLGRATTALSTITGKDYDTRELLEQLLGYLAERVRGWETDGFTSLHEELNGLLWGKGRRVLNKTSSGTVQGVIRGVDRAGELLMEDGRGHLVTVSSVTTLDYGR